MGGLCNPEGKSSSDAVVGLGDVLSESVICRYSYNRCNMHFAKKGESPAE